MNSTLLITGFVMGFFGSLHCIGMCGPIALGLSGVSGNKTERIFHILLYNGGRSISYGFMGLILGLFGNQLAMAGYQQLLSIIAGLLILMVFVFGYYFRTQIPLLKAWNTQIQHVLGNALNKSRTHWFHIEVGLLNAWLPCGLVYLALAASFATANAWHGSLFMMLFGLGTIPAMAGLMLAGNYISVTWRTRLNALIPYFIIGTACLLILRGLNLGIPFISPEIDTATNCVKHCCHK
jgi:uncharacterized protein